MIGDNREGYIVPGTIILRKGRFVPKEPKKVVLADDVCPQNRKLASKNISKFV